MATLEKITTGSIVRGIVPNQTVTIVAVNWHGSTAMIATYRLSDGNVAERLYGS